MKCRLDRPSPSVSWCKVALLKSRKRRMRFEFIGSGCTALWGKLPIIDAQLATQAPSQHSSRKMDGKIDALYSTMGDYGLRAFSEPKDAIQG